MLSQLNPFARAQFGRLSKILAVGLIVSAASFAGAGTKDGGGGNPIEARFKIKVLTIVGQMKSMFEPARRELKFDPVRLDATLKASGRFKPLCATTEVAMKMKDEGKMARVYPHAPNVVNLDCSNYSIDDWSKLFESSSPENAIFFIHESLRVIGQEDEDDYGISSSYLAAKQREAKLEKSLTSALLFPKAGGRCFFNIAVSVCHSRTSSHPSDLKNATVEMSLSIDGIQHYTVEEDVWINDKGCFDPSTFVQKHRIDLVEGKEILLKTKFRTLLEIARDNDACWENILTSK